MILFTIGFFSSCISTRKSSITSKVDAPKIEISSIKIDVEVRKEEKLQGSATFVVVLHFFKFGDNKYIYGIHYSNNYYPEIAISSLFTYRKELKIRAAAAYDAMSNTNADIMVNPQYSISKQNFFLFSIYKAEVTGYAGYFAKFYSID